MMTEEQIQIANLTQKIIAMFGKENCSKEVACASLCLTFSAVMADYDEESKVQKNLQVFNVMAIDYWKMGKSLEKETLQ